MEKLVKNANGYELDFYATLMWMDDEIRESLHIDFVNGYIKNNQDFFSNYEKQHETKHNEDWFLSKWNPIW